MGNKALLLKTPFSMLRDTVVLAYRGLDELNEIPLGAHVTWLKMKTALNRLSNTRTIYDSVKLPANMSIGKPQFEIEWERKS